jgi:hypothetical protein
MPTLANLAGVGAIHVAISATLDLALTANTPTGICYRCLGVHSLASFRGTLNALEAAKSIAFRMDIKRAGRWTVLSPVTVRSDNCTNVALLRRGLALLENLSTEKSDFGVMHWCERRMWIL